MPAEKPLHRHYYVDESGDPNVFNRRGKVILGEEGSSTYFLLGLLEIRDSGKLDALLGELRGSLLRDAYFSSVPSMQPRAGKTYRAFHAKDDLPEIRREVFRLLHDELTDLRFYAVVKDKRAVLNYVRDRNAADPSYRYKPNELYDYLVRRFSRRDFTRRIVTRFSYPSGAKKTAQRPF